MCVQERGGKGSQVHTAGILDASDNDIVSLVGVEAYTSLHTLLLGSNKISSLLLVKLVQCWHIESPKILS